MSQTLKNITITILSFGAFIVIVLAVSTSASAYTKMKAISDQKTGAIAQLISVEDNVWNIGLLFDNYGEIRPYQVRDIKVNYIYKVHGKEYSAVDRLEERRKIF